MCDEHRGPTLAETVAGRPVVLDGGLATRLEARGNDLSSALWSARLLLDDPDEIVAVHRDFFVAGAEVATTASYQASFEGLAALGLGREASVAVLRRSVELAARARDEMDDGRTAGWRRRWSVRRRARGRVRIPRGLRPDRRGAPPLASAQARGSRRAGPDVLALETIPCAAEAEALLAEVDAIGISAWLSLTCADGRTRAGEDVDDVFAMAADLAGVIAVGVNCCDAVDVAALLERAARSSGRPGIAYPNSGEDWDAAGRTWTGRATLIPTWWTPGWPRGRDWSADAAGSRLRR